MKKKILSVAEKPSVAKELSVIIAGGADKYRQSNGDSVYNKIYEINNCNFQGNVCDMLMTSVSGHMMEIEFDSAFKMWKSCDPSALFTAPIHKSVKKESDKLQSTLERLAKSCDILLLWLDCDMEGENIAFEVIEVCKSANPRLDVFRARFSALIKRDILRTMQNPDRPNKHFNEAVEARQEIDLRLGAIFTRFQTLRLQNKFDELQHVLISYGPCQFPTLGFVVDADDKIRNFIPEKFWNLKCTYQYPDPDGIINVNFNWDRGIIYDQFSCLLLYNLCFDYCDNTENNPRAVVTKVEAKPTSKYRPVPLNTIELQMRSSRFLKISSDQTMHAAESLYQQGVLSYPRTETDYFKEGFDIHGILNEFRNHNNWGDYVVNLLDNNKFLWPRNGGHDDQAHPPIHPTKSVNLDTIRDETERKIYELVTRHFLACCSHDAKGNETLISICIPNRVVARDGEFFHTTGLMVTERNWLDIYTYEKWYANKVPVFKTGDDFNLTTFLMTEGETTAPMHISESDLIKKMDDTGIGTDATIAEHIKTIIKRGYACKDGQRFIPTNLGRALYEGYNNIGYQMTSPELRATMERDCRLIARGETTKQLVVQNCLEIMKICYNNIIANAKKLDDAILKNYFNGNINQTNTINYNDITKYTTSHSKISICGICKGKMDIKSEITNRESGRRAIYCGFCNKGYLLPNNDVDIKPHDLTCLICQFQVLTITNKTNNKEYNICPYCYRKPPGPPFSEDDINEFRCLSCANIECSLSGRNVNDNINICPCSINGCTGFIRLKRAPNNKYLFSCSKQECKFTLWLPNRGIKAAQTCQDLLCQRCETKHNIEVHKVKLDLSLNAAPRGLPSEFILCPCCDNSWSNEFDSNPLPLPIRNINLVNTISEQPQINISGDNSRTATAFNSDYNAALTGMSNLVSKNKLKTSVKVTRENIATNANVNTNIISTNAINNNANNPLCVCGEPSVMRTSQKDNANKGRKFYACKKLADDKCNFFKWEDDANILMPTNSSYIQKNKFTTSFQSNKEPMICFKCKQSGHYARQCPTAT